MYNQLATFAPKSALRSSPTRSILIGAKPSDLPVEQPTTFEFTINRKTAETLGITIPQAMLATADVLID